MLRGTWQTRLRKQLLVYLSIAGLLFSETSAFASEDMVHMVGSSDNLTSIRNLYCDPSIKVSEIAKYNGFINPNLIHPGQTVRIKPQWLKATILPVKVIVFSGDVKLKKLSEKHAKPLTSMLELTEGDQLFTGTNSLVKLRFADDSVVNLQPNATMQILSSRKQLHADKMQIEVNVLQGRTEVLANPEHRANREFKVKTPSAVAVVRGTTFRVGAEDGKAVEETLGGNVDFAVGEHKVAVTKGFGSFAQGGQAPVAPIALPPAPAVERFPSKFDFAPINFQLPSHDDVAVVTAQLSQQSDFSSLISTERLDSSDQGAVLALGEIEDGEYFLKLRSENDKGLQSEDVVHAFTVDVYPLPPKPTLALDTVSFKPSAGWPLHWSQMQGVDSYVLQVSSDEGFEQLILEKSLFYNSFYLTSQLAEKAKYWRVGIHTDEDSIKFSKPVKLQTLN